MLCGVERPSCAGLCRVSWCVVMVVGLLCCVKLWCCCALLPCYCDVVLRWCRGAICAADSGAGWLLCGDALGRANPPDIHQLPCLLDPCAVLRAA